jgi:hypothetical protein
MTEFDGISDADLDAIRTTVMDYFEGWFTSDRDRMERAIHPSLAKRAVIRDAEAGPGLSLDESPAASMVKATGEGTGAKYSGPIGCEVVHAFRYIASVVARTDPYIEYLHLARIEGGWRIINALWEPTDAWYEDNERFAPYFTGR